MTRNATATTPRTYPQTYSKARIADLLNGAVAQSAYDCFVRVGDRTYVDFVAGLGPVILGHQRPEVDAAIEQQLRRGICFPTATAVESSVAALLHRLIPCAEEVRFLKNGADALQAAVRIARAVTGRDAIIHCGYHGWLDWCQQGPGVPRAVRALTTSVPFGDLDALERAVIRQRPAAFVAEPVVSQNPVMPPAEFWTQAKEVCHAYGTLLVFDEVVTGFRMPQFSAQAFFRVTPDLTAVSKAMANGVPISAVCGAADFLRGSRPGGEIFVSTTFGGDPLGLAAAEATLHVLRAQDVPTQLEQFGRELRALFTAYAATYHVEADLVGYFARQLPRFATPHAEQAFTKAVLAEGVLAPGFYNLMLAHVEHREQVLQAVDRAWNTGFRAAA